MTATIESVAEIRFQGFASGTEIWGATQADFIVVSPGRNSKEAAALLNDPAAKMLAEVLGKEDTPEFRESAARAVGHAAVTELVASRAPFDSSLIISRAYLAEHPSVLATAKAALAE